MSNEPSLFSGTPGSNLPDKPLIVKCNSNIRTQKLTSVNFRSARDCTYDKFQEKIRKHFGLTEPFTIEWQDDKKDRHSIHDDASLFMAIDFYHSGDKGSVAPSGSLFKLRSSSRHPKITMLVEICVDHDGLNLSKTPAASNEDYLPERSQIASLTGEFSISPQDDDAVTVSSKDRRGPKGKGRDDSTDLKRIWNGTSRSADSSSSNKPPLKPSRSRSFTFGSHTSSAEEETSGSIVRARLTGHSSDSLVNTVNSYPQEPLAILERLKLDQSILETQRGRTWLQNQNTPQKAMPGGVPSVSDDSFLYNTESPFSEDISHQNDEREKSDHNFTGFGSSESTDDLKVDLEDEAVNEVRPSKLQVQGTAPSFNFVASESAIPRLHELLVPEEVSDCSECGNILDQIKYICATCGEKPPMSRTALAKAAAGVREGSRVCDGYELCVMCFETVSLDHTMPSVAQELASARQRVPERKRELRHAFLFQMWGFNGWKDVEQDNISDHCFGCQSLLSGNWYKCATCDEFIICPGCYSEVHNIHPIHPFLVKPPLRSNQESNTRSERSNDAESLKHPGVQCFNCQQDIVGARFHCVNCLTVDIDICSNCETAGLPGNLDASDGGHNSSHMMLKIPTPLSMQEVQQFFWRAYGHRHGLNRTDSGGLFPLMRPSPGSVSDRTVSNANEGGTEIGREYCHPEVCNSCTLPIIGSRYQCLNCPSKPNSFNLCSGCEIKSYTVHDPMHTFLKIPRPVDNPGPLKSEFPIIPVLHRDPAGPAPGTPAADISRDPTAYLRDLKHTFALCDRHMMRIVGKWYRCAFCAKDLCADCEELDTHDNTHVFLVFKAPVDMQAFRHFADLGAPKGSPPPVLKGAIYHTTT